MLDSFDKDHLQDKNDDRLLLYDLLQGFLGLLFPGTIVAFVCACLAHPPDAIRRDPSRVDTVFTTTRRNPELPLRPHGSKHRRLLRRPQHLPMAHLRSQRQLRIARLPLLALDMSACAPCARRRPESGWVFFAFCLWCRTVPAAHGGFKSKKICVDEDRKYVTQATIVRCMSVFCVSVLSWSLSSLPPTRVIPSSHGSYTFLPLVLCSFPPSSTVHELVVYLPPALLTLLSFPHTGRWVSFSRALSRLPFLSFPYPTPPFPSTLHPPSPCSRSPLSSLSHSPSSLLPLLLRFPPH
ncbi:hypothetical protein C8J57DRAFT_1512614 [Mycena rebaudengoi]|nr:hypothetical protein C8J57DRAFT_1512614 [Mycena rebaudengoi]